jgi:C-terminal processing protease CtpA/Prc
VKTRWCNVRVLVLAMPLLPVWLGSVVIFAERGMAQSVSKLDKSQGQVMLSTIKDDIQHHYYDSTFHGINIDDRFKVASQKIDQATSNGQIFGIIAQALIELDDSHTYFIPPSFAARTEYGWTMQMIGDRCYIVAVKPGSDAEVKGVKPGDEVILAGGFPPSRQQLWKLHYLLYQLRPVPGLRLVLKNDSGQRQVDVASRVTVGKQVLDLTSSIDWSNYLRDLESENRLRAHLFVELGEDLAIWKMPEFDMAPDKVDDIMRKISKHKALILDMRGNPGGSEDMMLRLVGSLFDHDVKVGDLKSRKEAKPLVAKKGGAFSGKLILLVDSESASCSEILARVAQIEKRGVVLGDRTAGAVMRGRMWEHKIGVDTIIPYGAPVTDSDLIMADGNSLEKVGVTPDELLLPSGADLLAKRDPVLSRAAALAGLKLDPEKAGALFPVKWKK